jgi:hypothetical protein
MGHVVAQGRVYLCLVTAIFNMSNHPPKMTPGIERRKLRFVSLRKIIVLSISTTPSGYHAIAVPLLTNSSPTKNEPAAETVLNVSISKPWKHGPSRRGTRPSVFMCSCSIMSNHPPKMTPGIRRKNCFLFFILYFVCYLEI